MASSRSNLVRIASFLMASLLVPAAADAALHRVGSPDVRFTANGSMGMRIVGTSHALEVADDGTTVTVTVPLASLVTGIALRDQHMRDHLDVAHHPEATLTVPRASLSFPAGSEVSGEAEGTMSIHGQTHAVRFHYRAGHASGGIHVSGNARVDMSHYGISVPSYLGIEVDRHVEVAVVFDVRDP